MPYAQKLKDLRLSKGLSQAEVAAILQTTQQYYGKYELGERPLPVTHLITLCRFYKVSADEILGIEIPAKKV